jgi:hypothetical protein
MARESLQDLSMHRLTQHALSVMRGRGSPAPSLVPPTVSSPTVVTPDIYTDARFEQIVNQLI